MNDLSLVQVQALIDKANFAYYTTGNAIMDDTKYDKLKDRLKQLNPNDKRLASVGADVRDTILQKQTHSIPMGSLDKVTNETEWKDWLRNKLAKNSVSSNEMLAASFKMDGGSISLQYKDGKLIEAISRGDGITGENLTANAISFKGLPLSTKSSFSGFVRGEIVLNIDDWHKLDADKESNPRNMAVGIARRKNGAQCEHLTFYAFRMFDSNGNVFVNTEEEMTAKMEEYGFNAIESFVGDADDVWTFYKKVATIRPTLNFWIDGIVIKLNNLKKQLALGESSNNPVAQVAIKFEAEKAVSTLVDVKFEVGHSGALTPVAQFTPCQIGGTTITFASLYNFDNIINLDLHIGDTIEVIKANDIIPCVTDVIRKGINRQKIHAPTHCPVCNSKAEKKSNLSGTDSVAIYCTNTNCPSQITGKIEKYVKSLDIQGIGGSVIEALVSQMKVKDASDLYILKNRRTQLVNLTLSDKVQMGEKRADKILEEIDKKSKLPLNEFLGSLGIAGLGKRRVSLVQESLRGKMDKLENWLDNTLIINAHNSSLPKMVYDIHDELVKQKDYIQRFIDNGLVIAESTKSHLKDGAFLFCLTGKFDQKKEYYHAKIEQAGHGYTETYSKSVNYLVTADTSSTSSKMEKAKKNGTKVINDKQLLDLLK